MRIANATARAEADAIEAELERSLQSVALVVHADLATLAVPTPTGGLDTRAQWRAIGWMDPPLAIEGTQAEWWRERQLGREEIVLDDTEEIPLHARWERAYFAARQTRSVAAVPCLSMGHLLAYVVVETTREQHPWTDDELAFLSAFSDIVVSSEERRRTQVELLRAKSEAERASRAKSDFIANMSHELKTPLTAIMGFAELLAKGHAGELPDRAGRYAADILSAAEHLSGIVEDSLDIARVDAGCLTLAIQPTSLVGVLQGAAAQVRLRAEHAGVELRCELPETDDDSVLADARKLRQIALNLLVNAIKFTPAGGAVTMTARLAPGHFEIDVADTGVGIAPRDHERIFETFTRAGDGQRDGAGLGLALVRRLARAHGGEITLQSDIGRGSCFRVWLPRDARNHANRRQAFVRADET